MPPVAPVTSAVLSFELNAHRASLRSAQEVDQTLVQQVGALPLEEVAGARHDSGPDALGEGDLAALGEVARDDVVLGPVEHQRRDRVGLEEPRQLGAAARPPSVDS